MAADEITERFSDIQDELIADATKAEDERDATLARVAELEEQIARKQARMRAFYPIAHEAIDQYECEMHMHVYEELVIDSTANPDMMVKVPESDALVPLVDPICRTELTRVLYDLGYKSELLNNEQVHADFQISDQVGQQCVCGECGSEWTVDLDQDNERHMPHCSNHMYE